MKKGKTIHDQRYQSLISELAKERIRLSISQGELAAQIGLNQSDISKIEKYEKRLDVLEFSMVLEALRIDENTRLQQIVKKFTGFPNE
ncbi:helix-turn-helix domain-containing protein [Candidatus Venteria ishoeyi]|nr:helix-turn-helix transcriptional regulator [Candidatus Venteria ishoeyi]MDM8548316.1 helix-turn-helix transcriptional regulator [Candidatus Venteria ishoeyi]